MKKALALLLASAMAFTVSACGSAQQPTAPANGSGGEKPAETKADDGKKDPVKLRIAWWGGQSRHDYTLKVIDMYQQKNPHVKIEAEYAGFDDYWKKLAPQAAANDLPDIIQMDLSYLTQYGGRGQLEDLAPYIKQGLFKTEDISENALNAGKLGDKLLAANLGVNALGLVYDPAIAKDAGITLKEDWTWDDLEKMAPALKDKGKLLSGPPKPEVFFNYYLRTQGKSLFSADGTALGYTDDQLYVKFFGLIQRLYDAGVIEKLDVAAQKKGTPEEDELVKGNAMASWGWSNQYVLLAQLSKRPIEIHPMPGPNIDKGLFLKPSMYFSVTKNSKQKEEAVKFIDFFVNDIEANKLIKGERGIPVSSKVKEALKPLLTPEQVKTFDYVAWAEKHSSPIDAPDPIGSAEIAKMLKDLQDQVLYKKMSVEDAAAKFSKDANAVLAKNKK
ncbi:ABC transporter substrate-binding protein [Paenibacillus turpanensis]|uniref:ABC transporter substrate-binding protein n=1 Tax=Paenibacillus turpanensis TaxID=2689078 RepID=UPI00140D5FC6|nr:extracellular solute-binding protein [Paenibacillus turpanensis]